MSSYLILLSNAPVSFKAVMQSLIAQPTTEAGYVAAALTMKEAVLCFDPMMELGFGDPFLSVPVHIDNTSTPHVADNSAYSGRTRHSRVFAK